MPCITGVSQWRRGCQASEAVIVRPPHTQKHACDSGSNASTQWAILLLVSLLPL